MSWTVDSAVALALGSRQRPAVMARSLREAQGAQPVDDLRAAWRVLGLPRDDLPGVRATAASLVATARAQGDHIVGWTCPGYPPRLLLLPDPPLALWVRGDLAALTAPAVAIVGSRAARPAALETAYSLATDLARLGLVVVSGLARGVDGAAHRGALATGRTVAVLGTGIDSVYPHSHVGLATAVAGAGALLTEFVPGTPPRSHHFPLRNRILSGLVSAVVVVEAPERSGSLITARLALEQGRDVMVVPGDVRGGANKGGHALLRDGARLVESAGDVLEELGWSVTAGPPRVGHGASPPPPDDTVALPPVLALLRQTGGLAADDLAARLGVGASILLQDLLDLELAGLVARDGTGRYVPAERKW